MLFFRKKREQFSLTPEEVRRLHANLDKYPNTTLVRIELDYSSGIGPSVTAIYKKADLLKSKTFATVDITDFDSW